MSSARLELPYTIYAIYNIMKSVQPTQLSHFLLLLPAGQT